MSAFIIRAMEVSDLDNVYGLLSRTLDQYYAPEALSFFLAQWPQGQFVAVDYCGRTVGFIFGALLPGNRTTVSLLGVDSNNRGCGIGTALLEHFKRASVMWGSPVIQLEARANSPACSFYRKRGFLETENLSAFYNDGGDAVRMICTAYGGACN